MRIYAPAFVILFPGKNTTLMSVINGKFSPSEWVVSFVIFVLSRKNINFRFRKIQQNFVLEIWEFFKVLLGRNWLPHLHLESNCNGCFRKNKTETIFTRRNWTSLKNFPKTNSIKAYNVTDSIFPEYLICKICNFFGKRWLLLGRRGRN